LFPRLVIFTAVDEASFRTIANKLVENSYAPSWFAEIEYIVWHGVVKDLAFIPGAAVDDALIMDDFEPFIHPEQKTRWLKISHFDPPYSLEDADLERVLALLEALTE
jgi:hypothetical protein